MRFHRNRPTVPALRFVLDVVEIEDGWFFLAFEAQDQAADDAGAVEFLDGDAVFLPLALEAEGGGIFEAVVRDRRG